MNPSSIDFLLELVEHSLDTNRDEGLTLWSNTFDRLFVHLNISSCRRLLRLIKKSGTPSDVGKEAQILGLSAQGMLEIRLGNSNDAIACYKKALAYLQNTDNGKGTEAWLWSNLGYIHYLSGNFKDAVESYSRSMKLYQEVGDEKGMALALSNQGNVFRDSGELEKAGDCFREAFSLQQSYEEEENSAIS